MNKCDYNGTILTAANARSSKRVGYKNSIDVDVTIGGVHYDATLSLDCFGEWQACWIDGPNEDDLDYGLVEAVANLCGVAANVRRSR
jgi:hypothetical protein